jgi:hypothetical protein
LYILIFTFFDSREEDSHILNLERRLFNKILYKLIVMIAHDNNYSQFCHPFCELWIWQKRYACKVIDGVGWVAQCRLYNNQNTNNSWYLWYN